MLIKHLAEADTVSGNNWRSVRLLKKSDGMGFSFHETTILAGTQTPIWYKNHLEAVYCLEGQGEVELANGERHAITPGTLYALDLHDRHILRAFSQMRLMCVFNPALRGDEIHDADGSYPAS